MHARLALSPIFESLCHVDLKTIVTVTASGNNVQWNISTLERSIAATVVARSTRETTAHCAGRRRLKAPSHGRAFGQE